MKQNRLAKVFCALFFGALLCMSIYGVFFAEMEGSFDYFGTPVSLATLIRAESAM